MGNDAKQDPLFDAVKRLIVHSRIPSVAHVQIEFRVGYSRANNLLEAMEGDVVTIKNERGMRKMLHGETKERLDSVIFSAEEKL